MCLSEKEDLAVLGIKILLGAGRSAFHNVVDHVESQHRSHIQG